MNSTFNQSVVDLTPNDTGSSTGPMEQSMVHLIVFVDYIFLCPRAVYGQLKHHRLIQHYIA